MPTPMPRVLMSYYLRLLIPLRLRNTDLHRIDGTHGDSESETDHRQVTGASDLHSSAIRHKFNPCATACNLQTTSNIYAKHHRQ